MEIYLHEIKIIKIAVKYKIPSTSDKKYKITLFAFVNWTCF